MSYMSMEIYPKGASRVPLLSCRDRLVEYSNGLPGLLVWQLIKISARIARGRRHILIEKAACGHHIAAYTRLTA